MTTLRERKRESVRMLERERYRGGERRDILVLYSYSIHKSDGPTRNLLFKFL